MIKIEKWTARRAGGRITINGVNAETGETMKIVGVDQITGGRPGFGAASTLPIATDKTGAKYELAV